MRLDETDSTAGSTGIGLAELRSRTGLARDYPESFVALPTVALWLESATTFKRLAILARPDDPLLHRVSPIDSTAIDGYAVVSCPADAAHAEVLRDLLPWLRPTVLGLKTSAGFGDRLGLATPGHVLALRRTEPGSSVHSLAPIFAQQSIREMTRTGRSPTDVLSDATWGAFQSGWREPVGADADHLKTPEDIEATAAAGFSFFTIDPGQYVDNEADDAAPAVVRRKVDGLPWSDLQSSVNDLLQRYAGEAFELEDRTILLEEGAILRAAAKYGAAVAHVSRMYRHLTGTGVPFELEVSVDETETPTSHAEHVYIAAELRRLGVRWISLAPRYIGRFEKGVDYIGSLDALRADLAGHAAIARALGPYKLSLHSGSDKFSVYPLVGDVARGQVHLKTAGTSYLEALRVVAQIDPPFFRRIVSFARAHYERDRVTFHVSADLNRVPEPDALTDSQLLALLDSFDARQVLHVTFGSVIVAFRTPILDLLRAHETAYAETLARHFARHLEPFVHG